MTNQASWLAGWGGFTVFAFAVVHMASPDYLQK
jgi:hypothetical protein